jgi:hypothetical protein
MAYIFFLKRTEFFLLDWSDWYKTLTTADRFPDNNFSCWILLLHYVF